MFTHYINVVSTVLVYKSFLQFIENLNRPKIKNKNKQTNKPKKKKQEKPRN